MGVAGPFALEGRTEGPRQPAPPASETPTRVTEGHNTQWKKQNADRKIIRPRKLAASLFFSLPSPLIRA